jgi:TPR repeat protein
MEHAELTSVGRLMRCHRSGIRAAFVGLLFSVCLAASLAAAGPLEDGAEAAERGDYATALRLWRPLADQGNPYAQYKVGLAYDVMPRQRRGIVRLPTRAIQPPNLTLAFCMPTVEA